jgi:hypothetical protein
MSAMNIVCQPRHNVAHVLVDAASYDADGVVGSLGSKTFPVPHWPGVIATRGPALALSLLGVMLSREVRTFDEMVETIEEKLPPLVDLFDRWLSETVEINLAGWSHQRQSPEAYIIYTDNKLPPGESQVVADANGFFGNPYKLMRLPKVATGPGVSDVDLIIAADYEGIEINDDPDIVAWIMRKHLEMQRRTRFPSGNYCVGGWGQYTRILPDRIEQCVLQRWDEDRVDEVITPAPIDWKAFNATKSTLAPVIDFSSMSRLQRERHQKKMRKGKV